MKRYAPILLLALVLSACTIRFDIGVLVNEDETGTFGLFIGLDEELLSLVEDGGGEEFDLTSDLADVPEGWRVDELSEDGFDGAVMSTDFDNFEDLEAKMTELNDEGETDTGTDFLSDVELTREGQTFRFETTVVGLEESFSGALGEEDELLSGFDTGDLLGDLFDLRLKLTLPGEIGDHNADEVNGNDLVWFLDVSDEGATLHATSTISQVTELLRTLDAVDAHVSIDRELAGTLVLTLDSKGESDGFDYAAELSAADGWNLVAAESVAGQVQVTTEFDSLRDLERQIQTLQDNSAVGALAGYLAVWDVVDDGEEMKVSVDVADLNPSLAGAVADGALSDFTFRLTLPGDVDKSNADEVLGQTSQWSISATDAGGTYMAIADVGGLPIVVILAALVGVLVLAALVLVWLRRRTSGSEESAEPIAGSMVD